MNHDNQEPLDETLNQYYQQRKQQHKLPAEVKQNIMQLAREQHSKQKKSLLLRPPVWASTFAACFVIVISVYFMPLEPQFDNDSSYAPVTTKTKASDPEVLDQFAPGIPESKSTAPQTAQLQSIEAPVELQNARIDKLALNEHRAAAKKRKEDKLQAAKTFESENTYSAADMAAKPQLASGYQSKVFENKTQPPPPESVRFYQDESLETVAVSGARASSFTNRTMQISSDKLRITPPHLRAHDCDGETLVIAKTMLKGITSGDWVVITVDEQNNITQVKKLDKKPDGCNDNG